MPGLFGVLLKKPGIPRLSLQGMAHRMAESMRHTAWLRTEIWEDDWFCGGRVHLGTLNPQRQPLTTRSGSTRLWLDGECFAPATAGATEPSAEVLSELMSDSATKLAETDGIFNLASFDADRQQLTLATDRLGYRPFYYMESADWFAYAGEVKALLAIADKVPDLDHTSLRQYFGFGHMLGERTWWKGITLAPPATIVRVTEKGIATHRYWTFDTIHRESKDEAEVRGELARLWSEDVRRRLKPGTMPLLLSGGQDSRLLLAELRSLGVDLVAITFGNDESSDVRLARRAAAVAGVRHIICRSTEATWWHGRENAIWQTDGLVNGIHLHAAIAADAVHTGNCYGLMNVAGDLLFGGSHVPRNGVQDWRSSPEKLLEERYTPNPFFSWEEVVAVSVADARRYVDGVSPDCFHLRQRVRRLTLTGPGCLASHCDIVFPGLSSAILTLVLGSFLDEQRYGHKVYNPWLVNRHPDFFANVPWQLTGRGLAESFPTRLSRSMKARFNRLVRQRGQRVPADQWFVNYPEYVRTIRETLLEQDLIADQFLEGAAGQALADASRPLSAEALLAIFSFETYMRRQLRP
jgi:asparagine synthase (glutamine-hydrolysing)